MNEPRSPYEAPQSPLQAPASGAVSEAERVRNEHLQHEASIRGAGTLFMLSGLLMLPAGIVVIVGILLKGGNETEDGLGFAWLIGGIFVVLGAAQLWTGLGLRRLRSSARIPGVLFAVIGLLGFPLGSLIGLYILYLLLSEKGRVVLGADYARVRELTPHIRYRTPLVAWIVLGVLVAFMAFVARMALTS